MSTLNIHSVTKFQGDHLCSVPSIRHFQFWESRYFYETDLKSLDLNKSGLECGSWINDTITEQREKNLYRREEKKSPPFYENQNHTIPTQFAIITIY